MSYSIVQIQNVDYDKELRIGKVIAIVDDFVVRYPATYEQPAEYGPAVVESTFSLDEDEIIPENEAELELFFEDLCLDWKLVDTSDWYD